MVDRVREIYSLARAVRSEAGRDAPDIERVAVGWTVKNAAAYEGKTITKYVTDPFGTYGHQNEGRDVSTALEPREVELEVAARVYDGDAPDPTFGSTHFFNPVVQDRAVASGTSGYARTAEEVFRCWSAEKGEPCGDGRKGYGWEPVAYIGSNIFFRPRDAPVPFEPLRRRSVVASFAGPILLLGGAAALAYFRPAS